MKYIINFDSPVCFNRFVLDIAIQTEYLNSLRDSNPKILYNYNTHTVKEQLETWRKRDLVPCEIYLHIIVLVDFRKHILLEVKGIESHRRLPINIQISYLAQVWR